MNRRDRSRSLVHTLHTLLVAVAVPGVALALAACDDSSGTGGQGGTNTGGAGSSSTSVASTSTATTSSATTTVASSSSSGMPACTGNGDCVGDPGGEVCDPVSGDCVECTATDNPCVPGTSCDPVTLTCTAGCTSAADCTNIPGKPFCDPNSEKCVECLGESDCAPGTICSSKKCLPGCTPTHDCAMGSTCCGAECYDLTSDPLNCGGCDSPCQDLANATESCVATMCTFACDGAYADCDGTMMNGCEHNTLADGPCLCTPGAMQACYQGSPGTENVGPCHGGNRVCNAAGTGYGPCVGQVLPQPELCANAIDEDCDAVADNVTDQDGDGWTICNGDCCDAASPTCPSPKLVNPGALEVVGDGINNDCDAGTSDTVPTAACSTVAKFATVTPTNVANAMDICQTTTANPPLTSKKWGLISATWLLANGSAPTAAALLDIQNFQAAILQNYGTGGVVPHKFATMAGISTGRMRDKNDAGYVVPVTGTALATDIAFTPVPGAPLGTYLNAHGGNLLPGTCGATICQTGTGAQDSVNLRLQIRVPTNAQGFSYDFRFFTGEYQTFQCTQFNDYFLALLTSSVAGIPADHNISFDALGKAVSVNNGFFQICGGNGKNCNTCPGGTGPLVGTGMDDVLGGGTEWLTTDAPVTPGETMTLDLQIFDVSDDIYDSNVLLDNFRWALSPVVLGTHT